MTFSGLPSFPQVKWNLKSFSSSSVETNPSTTFTRPIKLLLGFLDRGFAANITPQGFEAVLGMLTLHATFLKENVTNDFVFFFQNGRGI